MMHTFIRIPQSGVPGAFYGFLAATHCTFELNHFTDSWERMIKRIRTCTCMLHTRTYSIYYKNRYYIHMGKYNSKFDFVCSKKE